MEIKIGNIESEIKYMDRLFSTNNHSELIIRGQILIKKFPKRFNFFRDRFSNLKEIVKKGFSIKHFSEHSDLCLAGEDKSFISKFMTKSGQSIFKPALAEDIFSEEDYVN